MITSLLYNFSITLYRTAILLASPFHKKAAQWIRGRKGLLNRLEAAIHNEDRIIWFHAASLGEFEQGRPLMETIKQERPEYKILLTFFSPSGYEVRKNYEGADFIFYLPIDSPHQARKFVEIVNPEMVFFIKYEFWFNYIQALRRAEIPLYYVSAIFRGDQHFFKPYGGWFRKQLKHITWFFVQNEASAALLKSIGIQKVSICGDTRFDRVWSVAQTRRAFPRVAEFAAGKPVLLAGSTWPPDEDILVQLLNEHPAAFRCIIAPHEIDPQRMDAFARKVSVPCIKYSEIADKDITQFAVLFIDNIGILLHLYQYAHIAYIGGGFGKNIHNILEAATFGKPVIFGPNYHKFQEAKDLRSLGGAFCVHDYPETDSIVMNLMDDPDFYHHSAATCSRYVKQNLGGTEHILSKVFTDLK